MKLIFYLLKKVYRYIKEHSNWTDWWSFGVFLCLWRWKDDFTELGGGGYKFIKHFHDSPDFLLVFHIMSKRISSKGGQLEQLLQLLFQWTAVLSFR